MSTKKAAATEAAYTAARAYYERTAECEAAWATAYNAAKAAGSRQIKPDANAAIHRLAAEIHAAGPAAHVAIAKAAYTKAREAYEADPTEITKWAEAIANRRLDSAYRELAEAEQAEQAAAIAELNAAEQAAAIEAARAAYRTADTDPAAQLAAYTAARATGATGFNASQIAAAIAEEAARERAAIEADGADGADDDEPTGSATGAGRDAARTGLWDDTIDETDEAHAAGRPAYEAALASGATYYAAMQAATAAILDATALYPNEAEAIAETIHNANQERRRSALGTPRGYPASGSATRRPAPPALAAIADAVCARDTAAADGRPEEAAAAQTTIDAYIGATGSAEPDGADPRSGADAARQEADERLTAARNAADAAEHTYRDARRNDLHVRTQTRNDDGPDARAQRSRAYDRMIEAEQAYHRATAARQAALLDRDGAIARQAQAAKQAETMRGQTA